MKRLRPRGTARCFLSAALTLVLGALVPSASAAEEVPVEADRPVLVELRAGWSFFDAGNLKKAEEQFTKAYKVEGGPHSAQVYYALSAVWWQRENARAAYEWLREASKTRDRAWDWRGGREMEWDRRIAGRIRYIERNFSVAKLRPPGMGKPLPPLADPPPRDPLLRRFADAVGTHVAEGAAVDAGIQYLFLPNGSYWVGQDLLELNSGEMEAHKAQTWDLLPDRGRNRKLYDDRKRAIAEGKSRALALQAAVRAEANTVAEVATGTEAGQTAGSAGSRRSKDNKRGSGGSAAAAEKGRPVKSAGSPPSAATSSSSESPSPSSSSTSTAAAPAALPASAATEAPGMLQKPVAYRVITSDMVQEVSGELSTRWKMGSFHIRYVVACASREAFHAIEFPDLGISVTVDKGGELKIRAAERLNVRLRSDWLISDAGQVNQVEMWFDGVRLQIAVNGVEYGPLLARREAPLSQVGMWRILTSEEDLRITHFWVEPWASGVMP